MQELNRTQCQQAVRAVRAALKAGRIDTERGMYCVVQRLFPRLPGWAIPLEVRNVLPMVPRRVLKEERFHHSWFQRQVHHRVFEDFYGRIWSETKGRARKATPVHRIGREYSIDALGGMSWRSTDGISFICLYRTTLEEQNCHCAQPHTFVG